MNAPTNVLIADILWDRFTVNYDYTRNTAPNAPMETGFQVNIVRLATNEVVQTEYVSAATRSVRVGSLAGSVFYRAEVRAITTTAAAFTTYTDAQLRYILSATGHQLPSLYSPWAVSPRAQTDDPPVAPVAPPTNLRWGSVSENHLSIHWDYQPLPGFAVATGFQVRACQNSISTVGCQTHTAARTARFQRVTPVDGGSSYWGSVRTVAAGQNPGDPPRYSNWVSVGPPRRTHSSTAIEFRNFTIRRIGQTADVQWSVEVRNATQIKLESTYQQTRSVAQTVTDVGPPLVASQEHWSNITGRPDFQGWYTITPENNRDDGIYRGTAVYTMRVYARNGSASGQTAVSLTISAAPQFVYQTIFQLGNRVLHTVAQGRVRYSGCARCWSNR